jgi:peptide deformylase
MVEIVQEGNKTLREIAKEVPVSRIKSDEIQKILKDMNEALDSQNDGVAIAAPQIGVSLRIFIVSGKIFNKEFMDGSSNFQSIKTHKNLFFINPIITKISKDKKVMDEGCLSVRPLFGKVRRATRATAEAYNEKGEKFKMNGSGLLAHIFQHETDHLEGILFTDKAKDLREILQ